MKTIKNILSYALIATGVVMIGSGSLFGLGYSSQTNGEEMHQRSLGDAFQATGMLLIELKGASKVHGQVELTTGTATLIAPDVIITAAHNFMFMKEMVAHSFQVKGVVSEMLYGQKFKNIWIHPDYNPEDSTNDIAIVQLSKPITNIRPAELQKTFPNDFDSMAATVVGYGLSGTNFDSSKNVQDGKRRAGDIYLSLDSIDKTELLSSISVDKNGFYAANTEDSKYKGFLSKGDSGGPVFIKVKDEVYPRVIGISSRTVMSSKKMPIMDVFISIPYHYKWIESKLKLCGAKPYNADNYNAVVMDYKKNGLGNIYDFIANTFSSGEKTVEKPAQKKETPKGPEVKDAFSEESLKPFFDSLYNSLSSDALNNVLSGVNTFFNEWYEAHKKLLFE